MCVVGQRSLQILWHFFQREAGSILLPLILSWHSCISQGSQRNRTNRIHTHTHTHTHTHMNLGASLVAQLVKTPPPLQETPIRFLGQEDLLEKG